MELRKRKTGLLCATAIILFMGCFFPGSNIFGKEREQYTSVTIELRDADTGGIFYTYVHPWQRVGKPYTYYVQEQVYQEGRGCYWYDADYEGTVSEIKALSRNAQENRIVLYYKLYEINQDDYAVNVTYKDADTQAVIRSDVENLGKQVSGYGLSDYYSIDMDYCMTGSDGNSYLYDVRNKNNKPIIKVDPNPVKNNVVLYYRKGTVNEGEAIVEVQYRCEDRWWESEGGYLAKSYIAGLSVGESYVCQDKEVLWKQRDYIYDFGVDSGEMVFWKEKSSLEIEALSADPKENVIVIWHESMVAIGGMAPWYRYAHIPIRYLDEDTGKVIMEGMESVEQADRFCYRPAQVFYAQNGQAYYLDNTKEGNQLEVNPRNNDIEDGKAICREQITAYYRPVRNDGDKTAVRVQYLDSATGGTIKTEEQIQLAGQPYHHAPQSTFTSGGLRYTLDAGHTGNFLSLPCVSGHPDIDGVDVYYTGTKLPESEGNKVKPGRVSLNKPQKPAGRKVKLSWKKVSGADGYQVVYADNKQFKKASKKTVVKNKITLKKLKKGSTCYVKVRAYKRNAAGQKVYGRFSKIRRVKIQ